MIVLILFAFLAGIVTILSPCILPILPIVLTSGIEGADTGRTRPLGIVCGFVLSFTFFTLFLSSLVRLSGIPADTLRLASVLIVAAMGISLLVPQFQAVTERLFARLAGFVPDSRNRVGFGGGLVIGLSVGLLWTPCVGPILASVISLAVTGAVTADAVLITLAYSTGTAIPMFLLIRGGQSIFKKIPRLTAHLDRVQKLFGVVMILTAAGIFFNLDRKFQTFVLSAFPQYGTGLTKIEDNTLVQKQLNQQSREPKGAKAAEIIPGGAWFNSQPLTLAQLKGRVVVIDFWTYSCINCQRTLPYLRSWYAKYKDKGLVIIGVHSPEFEFEKSEKNVARAIADFQLTYPIVQDNDFATWRAYDNSFWPAKYFIDKDGNIRYTHFGEGGYDESEKIIQELLKEAGAAGVDEKVDNPVYQVYAGTPETYLGYGRIDRLASPEKINRDTTAAYSIPQRLGNDQVAFGGNWQVMKEYANPQKGAVLELNFDAKEVFLVMRTTGTAARVKVFADDKLQGMGADNINGVVTVESDRLYKLINLPSPGRHILRLEFEDDSCLLYAFTFG